MKHPALARVFSVVLAILAVILLVSGVRGFGTAANDHAERLAYEKKMDGRIENYRTLHAELAEVADYDEVMEALDRFMTAHEKAAAQHKTDTALYSAKKGGLKMGEDLIVAARAQMNEIREQLRDASSRRAFLEALLTELIASQKSKMPWLEALASQASECAAESYFQGAKVTLVASELRLLMENEPTPESVKASPYNPPEPPVEMILPGYPDLLGLSLEDMPTAYESAEAAVLDAAAAYQRAAEDYVNQMQNYYAAAAQQTMGQLNTSPGNLRDAHIDASLSAEYQLAHSLWEDECKTVKEQLDLHESRAYITRLSAALNSLVRQGNGFASSTAFVVETGGLFPALAELTALADSTGARIDMRVDADPSHLSNEDFLDLTDAVEEFFELLTDAFIVVAQKLDNPASLIAELMDRTHLTDVLMKFLNQKLEQAEKQMQTALEELWYQLGEAEKDTYRLEAEKLGLDREAKLLSKRTLAADALKDLRSRHSSARQLLLNVPEVKESTTDDDALADNARAWLNTYSRETERLRQKKLLTNILAVVGGAMGVLGIPAAYELVRKRFLLIAPVLLCLVCAVGAAVLYKTLGVKEFYVALSTAIFALLQLLLVLPKAKKARYTPRH